MFVVSVDTLKLVRLLLNESGSMRLKFKLSFPMNLINFFFKGKQSLGYSHFLPLSCVHVSISINEILRFFN